MPSGIIIGFAIVAIISILLPVGILLLRKTKHRIEDLEKRVNTLEDHHSELVARAHQEISELKGVLYEKTNMLAANLNTLSAKAKTMIQKYNSVSEQIDNKIKPLQIWFDDSLSRLNSTQEVMKRVIKEGDKEIKIMSRDIDNFTEEIKKMKDIIRERTIDLEL